MEPPQNPKVVAAIKTIYTDNVFVLKIEKEVTEILQSVGVQQGNNMAPVLFLFLVTAFAETHEIVWKYQEILILSVMTASDKTLVDGRICSRTPAMFTPKKPTSYEILQCLSYMLMMAYSIGYGGGNGVHGSFF